MIEPTATPEDGGEQMRARTLAGRITLIAAVLVGGGTMLAGASIPGRDGTFTGCVNPGTGILRVIDADRQSCRAKERRITWNEQGVAGPQGEPGPQGPPGPPGALGSIDELEGLACDGGTGTVEVTYASDGTIALRCAAPPPPPPPDDCRPLSAFDPRSTAAYEDYPINGETDGNQYRSFLRTEFVPVVQDAATQVLTVASGWTSGHGAPIGLGDMSECDGSIPGTSIGAPGHPQGTHTGGFDIDIAYYQTGTADNRIRPVCTSRQDGVDQFHCVDEPTNLDASRTALFVEALASSGLVRIIGVDGRIGPILEAELQSLCDEGITDCSPVPLAYETTDQGLGWFQFHHFHMHVSFSRPR